MTQDTSKCGICGRLLDRPDDPLTRDCGGNCWSCIGEIEGDLEWSIAIQLSAGFSRKSPLACNRLSVTCVPLAA
jgi:hypothetical protein